MQHTPPVEPSRADSSMRLSTSGQWPGERHPTRWDVHDANECPAITFLDRFRVALLHSEDAEEDVLLDSDSAAEASEDVNTQGPARLYTYPMVLLSDVGVTPPQDELERLQALFSTSFKQHIFLDGVDIVDSSLNPLPPYLQLALACLSSVLSPSGDTGSSAVAVGPSRAEGSAGMFDSGAKLWSVMLEVENREARLLEAVLAASLLATYGILSGEETDWRTASGLLCNVVTISRRLHLTDGYSSLSASGEFQERDSGMRSSLISYMLLIDTMHAVHCGPAPNYSVSELFIKMPSSNHQFRTVYNLLTHGYTLPKDVTSREDALLLLTALLSDITYMQRCHLSGASLSRSSVDVVNDQPPTTHHMPLRNPYAPLTSQSESSRLTADMLAALSRWEQHFLQQAGSDILALYYFSKLQLICSDLWELPHLAGYGAATTSCSRHHPKSTQHARQLDISDEAMILAWLVLDICDKSSEPPERRFAVWLPIVLFLSALVVWQRLNSQTVNNLKYGTLKVLSLFKVEIAKLPWPCCMEMIKTLDGLMGE